MNLPNMPAEHALFWLWGIWYASWLASLLWAGRAQSRPDWRQHGAYQMATMAGVFLLFVVPSLPVVQPQLWTIVEPMGWLLLALTFLTFAFAWWARITMGRLWNGLISVNADHHIIDTGPFAIVRHPIYTAIIAAAFFLAIDLGTIAALAGAVMFALAFWMKASLEEVFLRKTLGPQDYDAYRRRVPMLVPFGPKAA
jgi:protein-S-isoprenylcysteine O-methyltransferase Ste14